MEKIVEGLKSVQPQARIFLLTRPRDASRADYSYDTWNDVDKYYLNGHMSPAGYLWTAMYLNEYIDRIIRENPSEFRDIALVGTPYRAEPW